MTELVDDTAQVFLGVRLNCAQCHHHPYEKWGREDYWGMAAFFTRIGRKNVPLAGQPTTLLALYTSSKGSLPGRPAPRQMTPLDGAARIDAARRRPASQLVDWMVDAKNPFFARALANRYWAHFFGRGIVDPIDDMRVTNPPSNPELLDALAKDLVEHRYSLKHLIRTICKSRTYQLSAVWNESNKLDRQSFARFYPRRLGAEVLYDAVCQVTDGPATFTDRYTRNKKTSGDDAQPPVSFLRAINLPDESFASYFLEIFGRPKRTTACEAERVNEPSLGQLLRLMNSREIEGKITRVGGRADRMARDPRPDAEKIEELFYWAVGRKPTKGQLAAALRLVAKHEKDKQAAYENIVWTLLVTNDFLINQ